MSKTARVHDTAEMRKAWEGIFASDYYFSMVFQPQIECCLLYPYIADGRLTDDQYRAVVDAARAAGDFGFYYSGTELTGSFSSPGHYWCEFPTYEEYHGLNMGMFETAMYAKDSSWGVGVSDAWHAVIGGTEDFIRRVDETCPEWRQHITETIDKWDEKIELKYTSLISLIAELLPYWNKYPADEWVTTLTRNIEYQLREYWKKRPEPAGAKWAARIAKEMNLKLDEQR